ncbi:MAG: DUF4837 family protein [Bacteroidota bacterium]
MMKNVFVILISFLIFTTGCDSTDTASTIGDSRPTAASGGVDLRPPATGAPGEMFFIIDPDQWNGPLGQEIRRTFAIKMPGLPQPEPMFTLRNIDPKDMSKVFRGMKNLIYVATLDNKSRAGKRLRRNFTGSSIAEINNDPTKFHFIKTDEFAIGQKVMHLFGRNEEELTNNIVEHREWLRKFFTKVENDRLAGTLFRVKESGLMDRLSREHKFTISIPRGYDLAYNQPQFVWLRRRDQGLDVDRGIFVYSEPYTDDQVFTPEGMQALRDRITRKYVRDPQKASIVMERQLENFEHAEMNYHGQYAVEVRGLWRLSDISLGGPYIAYALVDEERNRLIYFEGYVAAPGTEKRPYMMEMEVILDTFRVVKDITGT